MAGSWKVLQSFFRVLGLFHKTPPCIFWFIMFFSGKIRLSTVKGKRLRITNLCGNVRCDNFPQNVNNNNILGKNMFFKNIFGLQRMPSTKCHQVALGLLEFCLHQYKLHHFKSRIILVHFPFKLFN